MTGYRGCMQVTCPRCHNAVPVADINIEAMSALCRPCGELFRLDGKAPGADITFGTPARFHIADDSRHQLQVSWRWLRWQIVPLILFCLMWNGFLVMFYGLSWAGHGTAHHPAPQALLLVPLIHVSVGLGIAYYVIASLFNRTWVQADRDTLTVRHGPVPWWGGRSLMTSTLRNPRVVVSYTQKGRPQHNLVVETQGVDRTILRRLDNNEAQWLVQQLSARLPSSRATA